MKRISVCLLGVLLLLAALISCTPRPPGQSSELDGALGESLPAGQTIPLILSHDGAPDDIAAAAFIARHPQIDLLAVINSYGEQHPSESMDAWQRYLYEVLDQDTAAFGLGSEQSLDPQHNQFPADWRAGADYFWNVELPPASGEYQSSNGAGLIVKQVRDASAPVTVLVLGGQTDLALALQQDPGLTENIRQVVIMGGAFNQPGNLSEVPGYEHNPAAEWNIYVDALAAHQVFTSGAQVSVVPLDGSDDFFIDQSDLDLIQASDDPALQVLADLWSQQLEWWGGGGFKIWDIVAAVAVTNPEFFHWVEDGIDVDTDPGETHGQTFALNNGSQLTRYAVRTDFAAVHEKVFEILLSTEK